MPRKSGTLLPKSLAAKLATLNPGQTLYFDDRFTAGTATNMERQVHNLFNKSPVLAGRRFTTERWTAVRTSPPEAKQILAVTRTH